MSGLYIHIPFCRQACSYCDFYFVTKQDLRASFVDRLCREIDSYRDSIWSDDLFRTLYLGGGTPSRLTTGQLGRIFNALERVFNLRPEEVTMELNPEDVTTGYLKEIRQLGVNRASMGIQSFDPDRLRFMNRAHSPGQARGALEALSEAGFSRFTVDLIYGNPGQTLEDVDKDIDELLRFHPPHLSAYALTVEPGTRLGKEVARGVVAPPGEDEQAAHFEHIGQKLAEAGLRRYEVSNYSIPGSEALHNRNYWSHTDYLGLGPSAHSFRMDTSGGRRWRIRPDIRHYLSSADDELVTDMETLSSFDLAEERLMLGLRTRQGVTTDELNDRYGYIFSSGQADWIRRTTGRGYLIPGNGTLRLTDDGLKIADYLVAELLARH